MEDFSEQDREYATSPLPRIEAVPILQDLLSSNIGLLEIIVRYAVEGQLDPKALQEAIDLQRDLSHRIGGLAKIKVGSDG